MKALQAIIKVLWEIFPQKYYKKALRKRVNFYLHFLEYTYLKQKGTSYFSLEFTQCHYEAWGYKKKKHKKIKAYRKSV